MLGFDQFVNQSSGGGESHPALLPAGGHGEAGKQMGLSAAAVAYKDDGLGSVDVGVLREFVNLLRRDLRVPGKIEFIKRLYSWQMRFANSPRHQPLLTFLELGLEQRFEETKVGAAFAYRLLGDLGALRGNWVNVMTCTAAEWRPFPGLRSVYS